MKSIIKLSIYSAALWGAVFIGQAQVGIGTNTPDGSAALELQSTSKGFLTPRMSESQRLAITTPATGLLVYQTDAISGYWYYDGTTWVNMATTFSGQVLRTTVITAGSISVSGNGTSSLTYSAGYTPISTNSVLLIEVDGTYWIGGNGNDIYYSELKVGTTPAGYKYQSFNVGDGGGGRSSTLLPISGLYANNSLSPVTITARLYLNSGDDFLYEPATSDRIMKITEIQN